MLAAKPFDTHHTIEDVFTHWFDLMRREGVAMAGYHMMPAHGSTASRNTVVKSYGYPPGFAELYEDFAFRASDPIPLMAFDAGRPKRWAAIFARTDFTLAERKFLKTCEYYGLTEGVAMPLYGPDGRDGYLSMAFGRSLAWSDVNRTLEMQAVAQAAHVRITKIIQAEFIARAQLSSRERSVLNWMAQGKSNGDIAAIMKLSSNTVDTYTRRIFAKFQVNDRMTAVIVGLTNGMIKF